MVRTKENSRRKTNDLFLKTFTDMLVDNRYSVPESETDMLLASSGQRLTTLEDFIGSSKRKRTERDSHLIDVTTLRIVANMFRAAQADVFEKTGAMRIPVVTMDTIRHTLDTYGIDLHKVRLESISRIDDVDGLISVVNELLKKYDELYLRSEDAFYIRLRAAANRVGLDAYDLNIQVATHKRKKQRDRARS